MTQLPPLNGLRAFDAAGRHMNFRLAADDLGVTQGAVAQQVRLLEGALGVTLFDRQPRGLAFTQAGRGYHAQVAAAFADLRAATQVLRPMPGKVLVSVTPTFAAKWLIPNLSDFSDAHPDIDLRILATEKTSSFHSDGIDLAIRHGQPPFGASLDAFRLFRQDVIAVCAPHLTAPGEDLRQALARLPKLHDSHDLWPAFLAAQGIADGGGRGVRLNQTALAVDAALSGQGAALVSRFLVARDLAAGALIQVTAASLTDRQDFYLLARRTPKRGAAVEAALRWFLAHADGDI